MGFFGDSGPEPSSHPPKQDRRRLGQSAASDRFLVFHRRVSMRRSREPRCLQQRLPRRMNYETENIGTVVMSGEIVNSPLTDQLLEIEVGYEDGLFRFGGSRQDFAAWCNDAASPEVALIEQPITICLIPGNPVDGLAIESGRGIENVTAALVGDGPR